MNRRKKSKFSYQTFLHLHLEQIAQWITILESNFNRRPTTINLSWKQSHQKIIGVSFGASITAPQSKKRKAMIQSRQKIDNHLFPREHISESGVLESWELCGNQPVVSSSPIETRSSNQNSYNLRPDHN